MAVKKIIYITQTQVSSVLLNGGLGQWLFILKKKFRHLLQLSEKDAVFLYGDRINIAQILMGLKEELEKVMLKHLFWEKQ